MASTTTKPAGIPVEGVRQRARWLNSEYTRMTKEQAAKGKPAAALEKATVQEQKPTGSIQNVFEQKSRADLWQGAGGLKNPTQAAWSSSVNDVVQAYVDADTSRDGYVSREEQANWIPTLAQGSEIAAIKSVGVLAAWDAKPIEERNAIAATSGVQTPDEGFSP